MPVQYKLRNSAPKKPKPQDFATDASKAAVARIKANPSLLEQVKHQIETYNTRSAKGFDKLLIYMARTMKLEAEELSRVLHMSPKDIESWATPHGHAPNQLIRQKVVDYALKRLKEG